MLFQSLDKLKRQSILAAILMMALGVVMLICPESYVNTLVVTVLCEYSRCDRGLWDNYLCDRGDA